MFGVQVNISADPLFWFLVCVIVRMWAISKGR